MAASLAEVKVSKRTIGELEDITNNDGYHNNKKMKMNMNFKNMYFKGEGDERKRPQQQRSPSPSDLSSSSPTKSRTKSVTFELSQNKQYENSPLLTPKDDDDDYNDDDVNGAVDMAENTVQNEALGAQLGTNCDYLALTSSLRLLNTNKGKIEREIVDLSQMLDFHAKTPDKGEIIDFFSKLVDNKLNLPQQNKILRCPLIDWSKYHNGLTNVSKESFEACANEKSLFRTLNLFNSK
ncbi:DEHA2E07304p [Debaryomyces hansenii CBS767]|uniref:DEHA2E07304p n=1 Tax=Debaryomyces hansenii (strain ATCC 36239 / CBS 767 / BCRC 21394 / JCM 1990 / NBRC 0083 / IGC 2968) TaxID=284592 RepID=Q6BQ92_DEBHA|nr:DEHA2E07304p [Debaryomyces hansenii CBS767]CAG87858.2 DEHA2E07304p [Debaryomyces hansenii CBS767]|eukprot:XP_459628.2 DEHA2E07304p [Debaryomyces hansenii CBS767]